MHQKITIIGNLGRDPAMRYLPSGQAVTNMSVATNRKWTNNAGEKVDETTWFKVSVWGNQAKACNQYLKQGSKVMVEGRLRPDPDTGGPILFSRNDGTAGANFEITAQFVLFLSSKNESPAQAMADQVYADDPIDEEDIPF